MKWKETQLFVSDVFLQIHHAKKITSIHYLFLFKCLPSKSVAQIAHEYFVCNVSENFSST